MKGQGTTTWRRRALLGLAAGLVLGLSGCATLDPKAVQARLAGKSVVVASTLGPTVRLLWIGTTVFNNEYGDLPAADWELDRLAAEQIAQAMKASGRYGPVSVASGATRAKNGALVLPPGVSADHVVVLAPVGVGDPFYGTNQNFSGVGMGQRTVAGNGRAGAYAAISITIQDAAGKEVGSQVGTAYAPLAIRMSSGSPAPVVAPGDLPALRDAVRAQLAQAVDQALERTGLR